MLSGGGAFGLTCHISDTLLILFHTWSRYFLVTSMALVATDPALQGLLKIP